VPSQVSQMALPLQWCMVQAKCGGGGTQNAEWAVGQVQAGAVAVGKQVWWWWCRQADAVIGRSRWREGRGRHRGRSLAAPGIVQPPMRDPVQAQRVPAQKCKRGTRCSGAETQADSSESGGKRQSGSRQVQAACAGARCGGAECASQT